MRLATWNVQWFDSLFDRDGRARRDDGPSGREGITARRQLDAIAHVLRAIDPDGVMIQEGPDRVWDGRARDGVRMLERWAAEEGLRLRDCLGGFPSDTQQEILFLHDPDRFPARVDPRAHPGVPRFDGRYVAVLGGMAQSVAWSKPPLEIAGPGGLRLIGVHAKSKNPHGARTGTDAQRISRENRRKQLAQCQWLRARVDAELAEGHAVIVLGDFNDGPGLDEFEEGFGVSGVEIVLGQGGTALHDPHAAAALRPGAAQPATARFRVGADEGWFSALLDYVMVSADLRAATPRWRIWHPFDNPACWKDEALRAALMAASDHFPVVLDLPG